MSNTLDGTGTYKMQHTLVDVVINVYGKPYQTLCTLKSLLKHSGEYIDKIYFIEEKTHPYDNIVNWIIPKLDNIIHFIPREYVFIKGTSGDMNDEQNRWTNRYQYGIEKSDKKYVFIIHNDILFTGNMIKNMLSNIDDSIGIGLIGQCWNCSAFLAGKCDGDRHDKVDYSYDEVYEMMQSFPPARTDFYRHINHDKPMPLPECRLNELACLIDKEITMEQCYPNGDTPLFGSYDMLDLGDIWFRRLIDKGFTFKNYDINIDSDHGFFSKIASRNYNGDKSFHVSGYITQLDKDAYHKAEELAKEYYEQNFK